MIKQLTTERLILRQFEEVSAEQWQFLMNDKQVAFTTLSLNYPCTLKDAEAWRIQQIKRVKNSELLRWAIYKKEGKVLIGSLKLSINKKFESAELGYWLGKMYWGNGYAFEAASSVVNFTFQQLKFNRIEAYAMTNNLSSEKILLKLGFKQEGLHRKLIKRWGEFIDVKSFALLSEEWS